MALAALIVWFVVSGFIVGYESSRRGWAAWAVATTAIVSFNFLVQLTLKKIGVL